jgi:hypothetical protein
MSLRLEVEMPSDADYACMAYARGNREPWVVELVERTIREEQEESRKSGVSNVRDPAV